ERERVGRLARTAADGPRLWPVSRGTGGAVSGAVASAAHGPATSWSTANRCTANRPARPASGGSPAVPAPARGAGGTARSPLDGRRRLLGRPVAPLRRAQGAARPRPDGVGFLPGSAGEKRTRPGRIAVRPAGKVLSPAGGVQLGAGGLSRCRRRRAAA